MILSIHQPQYLPYLGFFDKISKSDVYVSLDTVQYLNRGFIHRNKIKTSPGCIWLTIPVTYKQGCLINEVEINNNIDWIEKHLKSLRLNYSKAPFFKEYWKELEAIYQNKCEKLSDFDEKLLSWILQKLGIRTKYLKLSELNIEGSGTLRVINLCKQLNCDTYLSGPGGKQYLEEEMFKKEGIKLTYQEFEHPSYEQRFEEFIPNLCILDLLFNYGKDSLKIIRGKRE